MSRPIQNYLFHVPHCGKVFDYAELEKQMHRRDAPPVVQVIDNANKKRLGTVPSSLALLKFK